MSFTVHSINQVELIKLIKAGTIESVHALGQRAGWHVVVRQAHGSFALAEVDGLQIFPTLSALEGYLQELGIGYFLIDVAALDQNAGDLETQERLREAKQAAEYDSSVRQQIQDALDDPRPGIAHSVVQKKFAARRANLLKKLAKA
jgi:hypothetical protein